MPPRLSRITDHVRWTAVLAVLAIAAAIALAPPLFTAVGLLVLALAVLIMRNPVWGAYGLVLSVPVQKAVSFDAGPIEITVTQTLFVFVLGVWWAWLSLRQDRRLVLTPIAVALLLFLVATLPSLRATTSLPHSLAEISRWLVTILAYAIMVNSVHTRRQMNVLIAVMLVAGLSEALLGLAQAYSGIAPESFVVEGGLARAYGTIGAPNSFAGYLNMSLPLAISLAAYHWWRWIRSRESGVGSRQSTGFRDNPHVSRFMFHASVGMSLIALVLFWTVLTTLSRGAWIGLAVGVLAMVFALGRRAWGAIALICGGAVLLVVLALTGALPAPIAERFGLLVSQLTLFDPRGVTPTPDDWAIIERMVHWQVAGNMFLSSPWVGVGIGNFDPLFQEFGIQGWPYSRGHAHNYYLHQLAETGVVGTTFYALMLITAVVVGIHALRRVRSAGDIYGEAVAIGALGILVTFMVHNIFENLHALNMGIHWGAALALFTLVERHRRHEADDRRPAIGDRETSIVHRPSSIVFR